MLRLRTLMTNENVSGSIFDKTKLKEQFEYVILVHASLVDLLKAECLAEPIGLKAKEVLDLIHTEEGLPECGEYWCKRQHGKL